MSLTQEQCVEFWNIADKDGDGVLSVQELTQAVKRYKPDLTDKECCCMFVGIDKNGDKQITRKEFFAEMAEKPKRSQALLGLFKKYDKDGNGTLNRDELRRLICDCFQPQQVDEIIQKFIEYSDTSGDGLVSYDEFKAFFG